jgi:hypothetical protein
MNNVGHNLMQFSAVPMAHLPIAYGRWNLQHQGMIHNFHLEPWPGQLERSEVRNVDREEYVRHEFAQK